MKKIEIKAAARKLLTMVDVFVLDENDRLFRVTDESNNSLITLDPMSEDFVKKVEEIKRFIDNDLEHLIRKKIDKTRINEIKGYLERILNLRENDPDGIIHDYIDNISNIVGSWC